MGSSAKASLAAFFKRLAQAKESLLLLDYDGTLAPFHTERHRAYPYSGVVPLLESILHCGTSRIVFITGRPIAELQSLIAPLCGIEIYGAYGLEHRLANGTFRQVLIAQETKVSLSNAESWLTAAGLGDRIEVKPGGIAIHWRGLPATEIEGIQVAMQTGLASYAKLPGLILLEFDGGLELRVAHPDKEDTVGSILGGVGPTVPVAYLGDDLTDEATFRMLKSRGLTVLIRSAYRETNAQIWMRPPHELIAFLQRWLDCISTGSGSVQNSSQSLAVMD